jgi:hypothetical protein
MAKSGSLTQPLRGENKKLTHLRSVLEFKDSRLAAYSIIVDFNLGFNFLIP